jgi:hypothetical protein
MLAIVPEQRNRSIQTSTTFRGRSSRQKGSQTLIFFPDVIASGMQVLILFDGVADMPPILQYAVQVSFNVAGFTGAQDQIIFSEPVTIVTDRPRGPSPNSRVPTHSS